MAGLRTDNLSLNNVRSNLFNLNDLFSSSHVQRYAVPSPVEVSP
jgi:hypothetical protein